MLLNYLKLSLRLLVRNPFFTFINVLGLSVGFAVFFILWQYAQYELESDQFHANSENIVRLGFDHRWTEKDNAWNGRKMGTNHLEVARRIASDFQEIEDITRIINQENFRLGMVPFHSAEVAFSIINENNEKITFNETKLAYADPNIFQFFTLPLTKGVPETVLSKPYSIVLSESKAKKYFGNKDCVGKTLELNDSILFTVTGVFKDLPHNTHLDFEMLASSETMKNGLIAMETKNLGGHCYFRLREGTDAAALQEKIRALKIKYWGELLHLVGCQCKGNVCTVCDVILFLQPLREIPFSNYETDYFIPKSKDTLIVLSVVSLVILLMAFVNYINLTVSLNHQRLKEFAARKTLGAQPGDLIAQFMVESGLINVMALLLAFTIIQLARFPLEVMFSFYVPAWSEISFLTLGIMLVAIVSGLLITGFYPALITMRQTPKSLFGAATVRLHRNLAGKFLTTSQYAAAIILIIWTFAICLQLNFILKKDLGINREDVVIIDLPLNADYNSNLQSFTNNLSQQKYILNFAISRSVVGDDPIADIFLNDVGSGMGTGTGGGDTNGGVDERFIPFYGIKLLAGRNFLPDNPADEHSIIVDLKAIEYTGVHDPESALGRKIWVQDQWPYDLWYPVEIIGVIESYSMRPLTKRGVSQTSSATVLTYKMLRKVDGPRKLSLRIEPAHFDQTIASLEVAFHNVYPGSVFHWYFLDEHINARFVSYRQERNQIILMSAIAIGIACLGLLGMITNLVTAKTKELGIRKVLGARLHQLGAVLLYSTVRQFLLAIVIALPAAYYLVQQHLNNFPERIGLNWTHYALPVVMLLLIMSSTIVAVVIKAARSNPVEALKYE